jgi:hypothetical protein
MQVIIFGSNAFSKCLRLLIGTKNGNLASIVDEIVPEIFLVITPHNLNTTVGHQPVPPPTSLKKILYHVGGSKETLIRFYDIVSRYCRKETKAHPKISNRRHRYSIGTGEFKIKGHASVNRLTLQ